MGRCKCPHCGHYVEIKIAIKTPKLHNDNHDPASKVFNDTNQTNENLDIDLGVLGIPYTAYYKLKKENITTMTELHSYIQTNGVTALALIKGVGPSTYHTISMFYENFMLKKKNTGGKDNENG